MIFLFPRWDMLVPWRVFMISFNNSYNTRHQKEVVTGHFSSETEACGTGSFESDPQINRPKQCLCQACVCFEELWVQIETKMIDFMMIYGFGSLI